MRTFQCEKCGKSVTTRSKTQRFCSHQCHSSTLGNPDKRTVFTCVVCGKQFTGWVSRNRSACSRLCASKLSIGHAKPTMRVPAFHVRKNCAWCGKEYETNRIQILLRGGKYCSNDCKFAAMSISKRAAGNPNYKGGPGCDRGPNWPSQSRKARRRDGYRCQACGVKQRELKRSLEVHHIQPYRTFNGDWASANQMSNLITLCKKCHAKAERGKIACPIPKH